VSLYQDRTLTCVDCDGTFTFSADDQAYYAAQGWHEPRRCRLCRAVKHQQHGDFAGLKTWPIVCDCCGESDTVPFEPRDDRPLYCHRCYRERRVST
jgi:CxxC-x17-CxxC domain-containing protein